ncbi:MAG TPA: YggS family pyridoxal phosphate-dependent enzyme [Bacteroidetes bacterium]|nr:YggS family pyridoxal phosphate-dependent enzyme [Bacteroidota bacterium]
MQETPVNIAENIRRLKQELPAGVTLVAISKTKTREEIMQAYDTGHRVFGENKVQELVSKGEALPRDIEWHMVGHLQSNKVKYIAPFVSLIQSVDSMKLLRVINKEGSKNGRVIPCLLQFHIAEEETKFGLDMQEAREMLDSPQFRDMTHVKILGVMGMATFTDRMEQVRKEFRKLAGIFRTLKNDYFRDDNSFREISMGMSGDYPVALEEGATMVRIGSLIFGERSCAI